MAWGLCAQDPAQLGDGALRTLCGWKGGAPQPCVAENGAPTTLCISENGASSGKLCGTNGGWWGQLRAGRASESGAGYPSPLAWP